MFILLSTGRIKELIITAGGENVPPVLIEDQMKAAMVAVSNCMVIGTCCCQHALSSTPDDQQIRSTHPQ